VDSKRFSIYGYDAMLEDLGIKDGSILFSHFKIPGKSLDEGLVPLISHQDVLSLLKYIPSYKEIEDDEVNEASETGYRCQSLLLNENDVQTRNINSTSKVDHPPWSSESLSDSDSNLSQDLIDMTKEVKAKQEMQEPVYYNFHPLMYDSDYGCSISGLKGDLETWNDDDDLLQQVDPYDWQQDPYHGDDKAK
ncbi:hypothetical protein Tco_0114065, partial [Tanacetum coccineum]